MSKDEEFSIDTHKFSRKESTAGSTTLLSQLGFADRDKQNPRHDLAIAYVRSKQDELAKFVWPTGETIIWKFAPEAIVHRVDAGGRGRSPFIIGFADALLIAERPGTGYPSVCLVEVKITPEPMGNCVRQMAAYKQGYEMLVANSQHAKDPKAVLIVDYDISTADKAMCEDNSILILRLGTDFDAFIQTVTKAKVGAL